MFDSMFIFADMCADSSLYIIDTTHAYLCICMFIISIRAAISITFPSTCFVVVLFVEKTTEFCAIMLTQFSPGATAWLCYMYGGN